MSRFLFALFALFTSAALAEAEPVDSGHALVELVADRVETQAGTEFYAGLKLELDENWHVYWRNAGDAGIPPMIIFSANTDVATAPFEWPAPHLLPVVEGQIMDYGYEDQVVLPFKVTVPDAVTGMITLEGVADFLICEDICIPEHADVRLDITVSDRMIPDIINGELIGEAMAEVPLAFEGEVALTRSAASWTLSLATPELADTNADLRFYPYTHSIIHAAAQPLRTGASGACLTLTPDINGDPAEALAPIEGIIIAEAGNGERQAWAISAEDGAVLGDTCTQAAGAVGSGARGGSINFISILFFALLGGLILNLMPCVLPVLSIKALGLVQAAASGEKAYLRAHGIWYTVGVLVSFATIAAAFIAVRAATGSASLGFQLQYAPAVSVLALVMFVIGLWLLGVFELGGSMIGAGSDLAAKQGNSGAFFTGVLAAVVGAPCVGPFLGVALGAVLTQPAITVLAVFLVLGFGLALPFLVLSFAPGLQRLLPKPGPWMERLRQFFAFPMFLTAAWLVSVLLPLAGISATV
ncbi:MAG: protein-disulfide reductase DsbD domain-containing protein, partial [Hyphomonadaceae bacterium]